MILFFTWSSFKSHQAGSDQWKVGDLFNPPENSSSLVSIDVILKNWLDECEKLLAILYQISCRADKSLQKWIHTRFLSCWSPSPSANELYLIQLSWQQKPSAPLPLLSSSFMPRLKTAAEKETAAFLVLNGSRRHLLRPFQVKFPPPSGNICSFFSERNFIW